jgi:hypothetical protein
VQVEEEYASGMVVITTNAALDVSAPVNAANIEIAATTTMRFVGAVVLPTMRVAM